MASTGKCTHCGSTLRSDQKTCPNCGAANEHYVSDSPRTIFKPKTIEELKEYCAERGMPLLRMRFFIGEDYKEPKAFGIYRDGKNVVVYKNKADGSRAVRYKGPDEAHAVNELFQKLLSECHNRGIYPDGEPVTRSSGSKPGTRSSGSSKKSSKDEDDSGGTIIMVFFCAFFGFFYLIFGLLMFPRFFLRSQVVLIPLLLSLFINSRIQKKFYAFQVWPKQPPAAERDRLPGSPITLREYLAHIGRGLRYGKPKSWSKLSPREQQADAKVGWVPGFLRILACMLLLMGIALSVRGLFHWNDGYYLRSDGRVVYHYGSDYYSTGGHDFDTSFPDDSDTGYYYLGDSWDEDWGPTYEPPTLRSSFEDTVEAFGEDMESHSSSDSDSSSSSDSWSSSDYDSWDSSDTDWDSDW